MQVFITGATGLIGSHVAETLRARGDHVVALVRPTSDTRHLDRIGCRTTVGDVLDPPPVQAARMEGCGAVVHAAALVFHRARRAEFLDANVKGTERVLQAAAEGASRVVHLSSVAVYAGLSMDRPLLEERWLEAEPRRQAAYPASKHLSEQAAWRHNDRGRIRLTTLRPSVVYGERDRAAAPILIRFTALPLVPLPGGGKTRLPLVYAGNVAAAVVGALDRPSSIGRAYNVGLDEPITARQLVELMGAATGRRIRTVPLPAGTLRTGATILDLLTRPLPFVDVRGLRRAARSVTHDNPYDSDRARAELDWTGHTPHREAVRRTVEWWAAQGEG